MSQRIAAEPALGAMAAKAAAPQPTRARQLANFVLFQAAWFAGVLGAAHDLPGWGTLCIVGVIAWHLAVSARPADEARLVAIVLVIGAVLETATVWQGHVAYPSGQPDPRLAPYWMVALWGLFAIALNVTLRWLRQRWLLAAVLGAVAGPLSYLSGAHLGAARFIDRTPALVWLALMWAVAMPALMWLSERFDGVAVPKDTHG
jgi:hypothetical protein